MVGQCCFRSTQKENLHWFTGTRSEQQNIYLMGQCPLPPPALPLREKTSISADTYAVAFGAWVGEGLYSLPCKAQLVPSCREVGTSFGQFFTSLLWTTTGSKKNQNSSNLHMEMELGIQYEVWFFWKIDFDSSSARGSENQTWLCINSNWNWWLTFG